MATLILSAAGNAIGGPIGSAIGAIIGQQIDQALFAPSPRQGPRLGDLSVQTSSYSTPIPKLFGATRISGTVIWATDLVETHTQSAGGKGRPATETFSYAASFAVALSARPIAGIGRIWADGKLIRGAEGDLKVETQLRLYTGDEDQAVDPLIASDEGTDLTPAYRGRAYAVFEMMALSEFGNRIPSLSFEVFGDPGPVSVGTAFAELCGGTIDAEPGPQLGGLAAAGDSVRGLAEAVGAILPLTLGEWNTRLALRFAPVAGGGIAAHDLGAASGDERVARIRYERQPLDTVPAQMAIGYQDPARDYQSGLQRAWREGGGLTSVRADLPATIHAATARGLAEQALALRATERTRAAIALPWRALALRPGMSVDLDGAGWRIAASRFERMTVQLDLVRAVSSMPVEISAAPGRSLFVSDVPHGPTTIALVDLPPLGDAIETAPQIAIFAAGVSTGWRRAALLVSTDGGASFESAGGTALPSTMGVTVGPLEARGTALIDRVGSVTVELLNASMALADADMPSLLAGANLAAIGDELLQFGRAEPLGGNRYRLSELWRGRRGSPVTGAGAAARFMLIEPDRYTMLPSASAVAGVTVMAAGIGDEAPFPLATSATAGRSVMPLAPVRFGSELQPNGDVIIHWIRRSRAGWAWLDGVDAPLGEERERYRVIKAAGAGAGAYDVSSPAFVYPAADRVADLGNGLASVGFSVAQVGTARLSPAAAIDVPTS